MSDKYLIDFTTFVLHFTTFIILGVVNNVVKLDPR